MEPWEEGKANPFLYILGGPVALPPYVESGYRAQMHLDVPPRPKQTWFQRLKHRLLSPK